MAASGATPDSPPPGTPDQLLRADGFRYRGTANRAALRDAFWREPGFRFTWYLRKVAGYRRGKLSLASPVYLWHRFWLNHYRFRYGFDISPTMQLGSGFYLGHFGGVVISPHAVIGRNVNVAKGVVIGATSRGPHKGAPTLCDRVWVGSNAVVVGRIVVGEGALIAPGAYVNFDVPPNAVVLGNPGKVVADTGSAGYINNVPVPTEVAS